MFNTVITAFICMIFVMLFSMMAYQIYLTDKKKTEEIMSMLDNFETQQNLKAKYETQQKEIKANEETFYKSNDVLSSLIAANNNRVRN